MNYWSVPEFLSQTPLSPEWLVQELIPDFGWTLLVGPAKLGKSILSAQLAESLSLGKPFLGMPTAKVGKIVYVQADEPEREWWEQLKHLGMHDAPFHTVTDLPPYPLDHLETRHKLLEYLKPASFVIWDSLYKLCLIDQNTQTGVMSALSRVKQTTPCPFLILGHPRKPSKDLPGTEDPVWGMAGSAALAQDASAILGLDREGLSKKGRLLRDEKIPLVRDGRGRWVLGPTSIKLDLTLPIDHPLRSIHD